MSSNNLITTVLNTVDLVLAEVRHIRAAGPHFRIIHALRLPGSHCLPGEAVHAALWVWRGREYQLRLSPAQLLLFDFMAHHSRVALSAKQIELGIRSDQFFKQLGKNANGRPALIRRIPRSSIKEHIKRTCSALMLVFREANLPIDPQRVVTIERTVSNVALYRIRATFQWTHLDLTSRDYQPPLREQRWLRDYFEGRNNRRQ